MTMTPDELRIVLNEYFQPLFYILGAGLAVIIIVLAIILVIKPFMRNV